MREISRRKPHLHNRRAPDLDAAIVAMAIAEPAWGPRRVSNQLAKQGRTISQAGVLRGAGHVLCGPFTGVGRIYQQTFIDTYAKVGFAKLYTETTPITAEFYRVVFRTRIYDRVEALQADLDPVIERYNTQRPHQGRWCDGKTPMQTCIDSVGLAREKLIA